MRLLHRTLTEFKYHAHTGETEVLNGTMHAGTYEPAYDSGTKYYGHISAPTGYASVNMFGINTQYTHILLMARVVDIKEDGLVEWKGDFYEVTAVRPSRNVLNVALKKRTKNHAPAIVTEEPAEETPEADDEDDHD